MQFLAYYDLVFNSKHRQCPCAQLICIDTPGTEACWTRGEADDGAAAGGGGGGAGAGAGGGAGEGGACAGEGGACVGGGVATEDGRWACAGEGGACAGGGMGE